MSITQGAHPRHRRFPGIAFLVAMLVLGAAPADVHSDRSLSDGLAGVGDPFIAGYTEEHPALPGPYADLPVRHYLAARDPITGAHLATDDPLTPGVAPSPLAAMGTWMD